jgi:hypothetical protein
VVIKFTFDFIFIRFLIKSYGATSFGISDFSLLKILVAIDNYCADSLILWELHIADIPSPSFLPYLLKEASSHQYLITL